MTFGSIKLMKYKVYKSIVIHHELLIYYSPFGRIIILTVFFKSYKNCIVQKLNDIKIKVSVHYILYCISIIIKHDSPTVLDATFTLNYLYVVSTVRIIICYPYTYIPSNVIKRLLWLVWVMFYVYRACNKLSVMLFLL